MKNAKLFINNVDTTSLGVILSDAAVSALMAPPEVKDYVVNENPTIDGDEVLETTPKLKSRTISLDIGLKAANLYQFLTRRQNLIDVMKGGSMDLVLRVWEGQSGIDISYNMKYLKCTQYDEYNGRLGKLTLKLYEPNPATQTSINVDMNNPPEY